MVLLELPSFLEFHPVQAENHSGDETLGAVERQIGVAPARLPSRLEVLVSDQTCAFLGIS